MFFTQLLPSSTHPIRQHLRQLVYQALVARRLMLTTHNGSLDMTEDTIGFRRDGNDSNKIR